VLSFGQAYKCWNHPLLWLDNVLSLCPKVFEVDSWMLKITMLKVYMAIICIVFLSFILNVVINSTLKIVDVSCDDNVTNLSYIIILSFHA